MADTGIDPQRVERALEEVAEWSGTISYEVLTAIGNRVERRLLDSAEETQVSPASPPS